MTPTRHAFVLPILRIAGILWLIAAAGAALAAEEATVSVPPRPSLQDPTLLLIRDESVRRELACSDQQGAQLDALLSKHNGVLLAIRDSGPSRASDTARPALQEIRAELNRLLTLAQRARLQGIILQTQGYDALCRKDVSDQLQLSPKQLEELTAISADVHQQAERLQQQAGPDTPEERRAKLNELQAARHQRILAVLNDQQTRAYGELLGSPFDLASVRPSPAYAPEFEGIRTWLNSPPLTMASLRGQVVVVHFFAFGCSNCINNYPWYRQWQAELHGRGVTIVGIHTPETQAETDVEQLRKSLEKHELKFPVAVDAEKKMWQAWHNGIWPSVYIIDRQGRLRYWWYGELDWQGAANQQVARQQIEQLLAESESAKPPAPLRPAARIGP